MSLGIWILVRFNLGYNFNSKVLVNFKITFST